MTTLPALRSIGIVLHDFPLGGTERIALRLARAWSARGVAVTLFVGEDKGPLRDMVPSAVRLVPAEPPIPRSKGSRERLGEAAAAHFTREPVDAIFVPGNFHWEIVPALATIPQPPAILAQISSPIRKVQRGWWSQRLFERRMRRLLGRADALVALDAVAAREADRVMRREISTVIASPVLDDAAPPPEPAPASNRLLAAGRLHPQKDFETLLRAFARIGSRDARLTIAGEGPDRATLQALAAKLGIADRVDWPGYVPDIRPLLNEARLFVLSSAYEGYPAVLVEALAAGRAVAATDCAPAVGMLLEGRPWGRIARIGDAAGLATAIDSLLALPPPDGATIAATVEHHRLGPSAQAYLDLAAALVARRRTA